MNIFTKVKPGQVWEKRTDTEDPFEIPWVLRHTVMEVRAGWVKYATVSNFSGRHAPGPWFGASTAKIKWFKSGAKLISP